QKQPDCVAAYTEAMELAKRIDDRQVEALCASNLGIAYRSLPGLRHLDQAERWLRHALDRYDPADQLRRARSTLALGTVYLERFDDALAAGRPEVELSGHLNAALTAYQEALDLHPEGAVSDIAATQNQ